MVVAGAALLEKNREAVDALNVFPVPDGDTGTNMSLTMQSATREVNAQEYLRADEAAAAISKGALKGARGNSGVITSQLLRGFATSLKGVEKITPVQFAQALKAGSDKAYKAVMKPKEGTILTVARVIAEDAIKYLKEQASFPTVLKADGLALGKGVLICNTLEEALAGVDEIMLDKKFGAAGNRMVIEEFMTGREVSVLSFVDGKTIRIMTSAQDHKRAKDGDQGLNTGGMGTFSPSPFYTEEVDAFCKKYIYQATVDAMAAEGRPFKGVIFFGLMLTPNGPKVLEYNARFGDPEAQVVLPRMKNDIIEVMEACVDGTLDQIDLQFEDNAAVCVVLASDGYPVSYEKGYVINGLEKFNGKDGYYCFHAGTKLTDKGIVTNGGRVLGVTAKGATLKEARANAYAATEWITFENKYMRHDIGKAIDEA